MSMFGNKNQAFDYHSGSAAITCQAQTAITGKTFVKVAPETPLHGNNERVRVIPAAAGERAFGVAGWDTTVGEGVTVFRERTISVTAGEGISAGDLIAVGADGKAVKAAGAAIVMGIAERPAAINTDAAVALI